MQHMPRESETRKGEDEQIERPTRAEEATNMNLSSDRTDETELRAQLVTLGTLKTHLASKNWSVPSRGKACFARK